MRTKTTTAVSHLAILAREPFRSGCPSSYLIDLEPCMRAQAAADAGKAADAAWLRLASLSQTDPAYRTARAAAYRAMTAAAQAEALTTSTETER